MSDAKSQPAPSMEEILASIKGLMTDDRPSVVPAARSLPEAKPMPTLAAPGGKEDVLELTEAIDPDGSVRRIAPAEAARAPQTAGNHLVSAATSEAAAAAFARLAAPPREAPPPAIGGRTLDDLVREALRPLLQSWLDQHLPALVERLVREEIARLAGGEHGR